MHQTRLVQTQTATQILIEIFPQSRQICCGSKYIGKVVTRCTIPVLMLVHLDQHNPGVDIAIDLPWTLNNPTPGQPR